MADGNRRGSKGSIYAYTTEAGARYRFVPVTEDDPGPKDSADWSLAG
jgi:hypothetical protein